MSRKINTKFNCNKCKELHVGRSVSGTNKGEDSAGGNGCSESDGEVTFFYKHNVN